jgi:secondary thiamine-phosphate synthase enzyme
MGWYREFSYSGTTGTDIHDLTHDLRDAVREWGVTEGVATVFAPGSTAAVTMIEYESGVLEDLRRAVEKIAPANLDYAHNAAWGDGNGYSHVRSALLGPSVSIPVHEGELVLGTWQQVVLLDFDNKARRRRLVLQVMGE